MLKVEGETVFKCPDGKVCTRHKEICRPNCGDDPSRPVIPTKCGICEASPNKLFACISESVFVFCYGKDVPFVGSEGQCKSGYVCDVNNPRVCSPEDTVHPSCVTDLTGLPTIPLGNTSECPGTYNITTDITATTKDPEEDLKTRCAENPGSTVVKLAGCRE